MRTVSLLVLALVLAGCNLPYKLPEGAAHTAKVRFSVPEAARTATNVGVYVLSDEESCGDAKKVRLLGGLQLGGMSDDKVDIGMFKDPQATYGKNLYVEIPVVAEKRFNFAFAGHHGFHECRLTMSFLPKTDRQYEVGYFTDGPRCYGVISELIRVGERVQVSKEISARKNLHTCKIFWN